jgi:DNA repair exonuclease SbcCD ATPase subunit
MGLDLTVYRIKNAAEHKKAIEELQRLKTQAKSIEKIEEKIAKKLQTEPEIAKAIDELYNEVKRIDKHAEKDVLVHSIARYICRLLSNTGTDDIFISASLQCSFMLNDEPYCVKVRNIAKEYIDRVLYPMIETKLARIKNEIASLHNIIGKIERLEQIIEENEEPVLYWRNAWEIYYWFLTRVKFYNDDTISEYFNGDVLLQLKSDCEKALQIIRNNNDENAAEEQIQEIFPYVKIDKRFIELLKDTIIKIDKLNPKKTEIYYCFASY